jgi:hypothetical protein
VFSSDGFVDTREGDVHEIDELNDDEYLDSVDGVGIIVIKVDLSDVPIEGTSQSPSHLPWSQPLTLLPYHLLQLWSILIGSLLRRWSR